MNVTRESAERLVEELVKGGDIRVDEAKGFVEELIERGAKQREFLTNLVRSEIMKALDVAGIATKEDIKRLEDKLNKIATDIAKNE